jgi:hypothetical protein
MAEEVLVSEQGEDYWTRKEKYNKMVENSALCWHKLYTEEKTAREELEAKYNELVQKVKQQGLDRANNKKVDDGSRYLQSYALMWKRL